MNWKEWENLVNKSFIEIGFNVAKRKTSEIIDNLAIDVERDGLGKHIIFSNLVVDIECKKHQNPIDYDIINNSFGIKDSFERKGLTVFSVVASYEGFTDRAKKVALEKGILLLSKDNQEILEKIAKDLELLKFSHIMEKPQERVPNISGTTDFEFFDRLNEMLKIFHKISIENPPITIKKVTKSLMKNEKFLQKHTQLRNEGKFTFLQDYKKLFRVILKFVIQKKIKNRIEIYLTNNFFDYKIMSRIDQKGYFLFNLLQYEGFYNYLVLSHNASHLLKQLKNQVEVRNFRNWLKYLEIDEEKENLMILISCSIILREISNLKLHSQISKEIESSIREILKSLLDK